TDEEIEVVPNLMIGFGIDKTQAEYVAEIKLRHLNREYILKRTQDIEQLEKEIAELDDILKSKARIKTIIVRELKAIAAQYGEPRRSIIIYEDTVQYVEEAAAVPDYACTFFFTKEGYFKKITPQSLRMSGAHKLKDGDEITQEIELSNNCDLLFFTDKAQVYKAKASDFSDTKTSVLGDYVAAKLGMDEGENAVYLVATKDYKGLLLFAFENGKAAKVPLEAYATKTNRKKLTGAYSDKAPMTAMLWLDEDREVLFSASSGRMLLIHTGVLTLKATRTTQGVAVMKLKKGQQLIGVKAYAEGTFVKPQRYRTRSLPALGALPTGEDKGEEQLSLI
ncbi:MAG: topoisomerase IV, partial [Ruminococcus sp.]|nr:topoisomerase IV [Ruminococcus sp.]